MGIIILVFAEKFYLVKNVPAGYIYSFRLSVVLFCNQDHWNVWTQIIMINWNAFDLFEIMEGS